MKSKWIVISGESGKIREIIKPGSDLSGVAPEDFVIEVKGRVTFRLKELVGFSHIYQLLLNDENVIKRSSNWG